MLESWLVEEVTGLGTERTKQTVLADVFLLIEVPAADLVPALDQLVYEFWKQAVPLDVLSIVLGLDSDRIEDDIQSLILILWLAYLPVS